MRKFAVPMIAIAALLLTFAGCTDKETLKEIQETQKEILTKLGNLETKMAQVQTPPRRPTVDYDKVYNLPVAHSAIKGEKTAPVTIVEFSDFQCPYCARLQPTLNQVLTTYPKQVKLVYKHYPLSFHKQAKNAAKACEAAREQGKFWEMHDLIFANFNKLTDASFTDFSKQLGLDQAKFAADFMSTKYDKLIENDIALARTAGVTGTPTLYLNGKRMRNRSFDDFKAGIDAILKEQG